MTKSNVISFQERKQAISKGRLEAILELLRSKDMTAPFPDDLTYDEDTGDLVTSPESWAYFERTYTAFGLTMPRSLNAKVAIGSITYLEGHLGSKIELRSSGTSTYDMVKSLLSADERVYIDALFGVGPDLPDAVIQRLGVWEKLPPAAA